MQQNRTAGSVSPSLWYSLGWCRRNYGVRGAPSPLMVSGLIASQLSWAVAATAEVPSAPPMGSTLVGTSAFGARSDSSDVAPPFGEPLNFDAFDRRRDAPINEEPNYRSDGVYGRFDGELSLIPAVGLQWTQAGWFTQFGLSAYYLNTVGIQFHVADGRWSPIAKRADFNVSTLSLALRPLFLLRWSKDWEKGPSFLDLAIDSLTLSLGGYYSQEQGVDAHHQGLETELSFGFPLLGKAHGPWLTASGVNRLPKVTHGTNKIDLAFGLRFEWSFSLGS